MVSSHTLPGFHRVYLTRTYQGIFPTAMDQFLLVLYDIPGTTYQLLCPDRERPFGC